MARSAHGTRRFARIYQVGIANRWLTAIWLPWGWCDTNSHRGGDQMGATQSQPTTHPAGLHDDLPRKFEQVIEWAASGQQLDEFAREWRACLEKAIAEDDLRPVSDI